MIDFRYPPIADMQQPKQTHRVSDYRSPSFVDALGIAFLVSSIGTWLLVGENWLAWSSMCLAGALLTEANFWRLTADIAAMLYQKASDDIRREAYIVGRAMLRCCCFFAFLLLAYLLGRAGMDVLPNDGWTVVFIIGGGAVLVVSAGFTYRQDILSVAQRNKWPKRTRRRR